MAPKAPLSIVKGCDTLPPLQSHDCMLDGSALQPVVAFHAHMTMICDFFACFWLFFGQLAAKTIHLNE